MDEIREEFLAMIAASPGEDDTEFTLDHPFVAAATHHRNGDNAKGNDHALEALPHWTLQARQAGAELLLKYVEAPGNPLRAVAPTLALLCGLSIDDEEDFQAFADEEPQILSVFYGMLDWFDLLLETSEETGQQVRSMMYSHIKHHRPGVSLSDREGKLGEWLPGFGPLRE